MRAFCARCGREESAGTPLIQGLCAECFLSTRRIVQLPDSIEVVRCGVCGAIKSRGGRFLAIDLVDHIRGLLEGYVARGVVAEGVSQASIGRVEIQEDVAVVEVVGVAGGTALRQVLRVRVATETTLCPGCFKRKTRSFEAVIQLRPGNRRAVALVSRLAGELYGHPGVVDAKETRDGVDLYVAEKSTAARIVRSLESRYIARVLSTWEGFKHSPRKPKAVFSVRIYGIERGDLVELDGALYEVVDAGPQTVVLRNLRSGRVLNLSISNLLRRNPVFHDGTRDDTHSAIS